MKLMNDLPPMHELPEFVVPMVSSSVWAFLLSLSLPVPFLLYRFLISLFHPTCCLKLLRTAMVPINVGIDDDGNK